MTYQNILLHKIFLQFITSYHILPLKEVNMAEVITFGCRINAYESEVIKEKLKNYDNLIVVNTCAVTGEAERQCRQTIRKLKRENPTAEIIVTGCSA